MMAIIHFTNWSTFKQTKTYIGGSAKTNAATDESGMTMHHTKNWSVLSTNFVSPPARMMPVKHGAW
jgi:hypothetical protein